MSIQQLVSALENVLLEIKDVFESLQSRILCLWSYDSSPEEKSDSQLQRKKGSICMFYVYKWLSLQFEVSSHLSCVLQISNILTSHLQGMAFQGKLKVFIMLNQTVRSMSHLVYQANGQSQQWCQRSSCNYGCNFK